MASVLNTLYITIFYLSYFTNTTFTVFYTIFTIFLTKLPKTINPRLSIKNRNVTQRFILNTLLKTLLIYIRNRMGKTGEP